MNQNRAIGLLVLVIIVAAIISYARAALQGVTWSFWSSVPGSSPLKNEHPWDYLVMAIIIICAIVFMWQYQKKK